MFCVKVAKIEVECQVPFVDFPAFEGVLFRLFDLYKNSSAVWAGNIESLAPARVRPIIETRLAEGLQTHSVGMDNSRFISILDLHANSAIGGTTTRTV